MKRQSVWEIIVWPRFILAKGLIHLQGLFGEGRIENGIVEYESAAVS